MIAFRKGKNYRYGEIESRVSKASSEDDPLVIDEYGVEVCGQSFLVVDEGRKTFSFVLSGTMGGDYIYKCIFAG